MHHAQQFVVWTLDTQRYAVWLAAVERVVRLVAITPVPHAPDIVLGVINVQGRILPVVNLRQRFRLPERRRLLSDQLLIARTSRRTVALLVDAVTEVIACPEEAVLTGETVLPGMAYVEGVLRLADGLLLIHNLDTCLSLEEESCPGQRDVLPETEGMTVGHLMALIRTMTAQEAS